MVGKQIQIQDIGQLFRLITPLLILIIGWLLNDKLTTMTTTQQTNTDRLAEISLKISRLETLEDDVLRNRLRLDGHDGRIRSIEIYRGNHEN